MSETLKCVVCEVEHLRGTDQIGFWMPTDNPETHYPVCLGCVNSERHEQWRAKAISTVRNSGIAFISKGNLADDYRETLSFQKHDDRIKDGVCPNGCARMVQIEGRDFECPVCHFVLHQRTLHMPPP